MTGKNSSDAANALADLPSLGVTSAQMLIEAGVPDVETLRSLGAISCFRSLRFRFGKRVSINFVYAIECAIEGLHWRALEAKRRKALRDQARVVIQDLERKV